MMINRCCRRGRWFTSGRWTLSDQPCSTSTYNLPIIPGARGWLFGEIPFWYLLTTLASDFTSKGRRKGSDSQMMAHGWFPPGPACAGLPSSLTGGQASSCQLLAKTWVCSPLGFWDLVLLQEPPKSILQRLGRASHITGSSRKPLLSLSGALEVIHFFPRCYLCLSLLMASLAICFLYL